MQKVISRSAAVLTIALGLAVSAIALPHPPMQTGQRYCSTLSKIGKAITYPVKKAAGSASKTLNKTGQAAQYPVRKAGENTSKAAHKSGLK